ncbi:MAG: PKD domain-containing protein, partial [Bacteroidota bacterium]
TAASFATGGLGAPSQEVFIDIALPGLDNQSGPVYLRWQYENTSIFGRGDGLAIDSVSLRWDVLPLTVDLGGDRTLCSGESVSLDPGVASGSFLWTNGDTTPTLNVSTAGNVGVQVEHNTGQVAGDTISVSVAPGPSGATLTENANSQGTHLSGTSGQPDTVCGFNPIIYDFANPGGYADSSYGLSWQVSNLTVERVGSGAPSAGSLTFNPPGSGKTLSFTPDAADGDNVFRLSFTIDDLQTGCEESYQRFIYVGAVASATGLPEERFLCFSGDTVLLNANVPEQVTYQWSTNATDGLISVSTPGTYSVTLLSPGGCSFSDTVKVAFEPHELDLGPDTFTVCGQTVLDASYPGEGDGLFVWQNGSTAPTFTATTSGHYFVHRKTPSGCLQKDTLFVNVRPLPSRGNLPEEIGACPGDELVLNTGNLSATHLWSTGESSTFITVSEPDTYSVQMTGGGCTTTYETVVFALPTPAILLPETLEGCEEAVLSAGNPGLPHLWSTGETTPSIVVNTDGTYSVSVTNALGCTAEQSVVVTIVEPPSLELLTQPQVVSPGEPVDFSATADSEELSWLWSFGNGAFSNLPNAIDYSYPENGTFNAVVSISEGPCVVSDSVQIVVEGTLSRGGALAGGFSVYPNPVHEVLHIEGLPAGEHTVVLRDMLGRVAWQTRIAGGQAQLSLPLHIKSGTYTLQVGALGAQKIVLMR